MRTEDLIYKDENYEIYKKDSGRIGSFAPLDCLEIIDICIEELKKWNNAGLARKEDYEEIIEKIVEELRKLPV